MLTDKEHEQIVRALMHSKSNCDGKTVWLDANAVFGIIAGFADSDKAGKVVVTGKESCTVHTNWTFSKANRHC